MAAPAPGRAWEESEERPVRLGRECIIPWGSSRTFVSNVGLGWVPGGSRFFSEQVLGPPQIVNHNTAKIPRLFLEMRTSQTIPPLD